MHQSRSETENSAYVVLDNDCDAADAAVTTATAKQLSTDSQQAALQIMMPHSLQRC